MADKFIRPNPYVVGVPITGDTGFYGRHNIFTFVKNVLDSEQQNVVVLYGQRRIGKTSLLHQIVTQLNEEEQILPVYFDLQGKEQQDIGQVLYHLARTVARSLSMPRPKQDEFDDNGIFFREEFLPEIYERLGNRRLLFLFDEFDVLGDELASPKAASETLFPYLQDLIMHVSRIAFIFVVGRRIDELPTHFQAVFKQAAYQQIGLLRLEDAQLLITEPTKDFLTFEKNSIGTILNLTSGHPYFTQLLCFEIFNAVKAEDQPIVTHADVLTRVDQAIETGHGALNWFWDGLPRAERFILSAIARVTDETGLATKNSIRQGLEQHRVLLTGLELTDAPDRLVEWKILIRDGPENYRFVVELVRRWIVKEHPLENVRRDVDFINPRAVRHFRNAHDAHAEGDLEYARDEYRRALASNLNHGGAQLGLAQVLFELGQMEAATEEFSKAYLLDEVGARDGLVQARLMWAKQLETAERYREAILQYQRILKVSPNNEMARQTLSTLNSRLEERSSSRRYTLVALLIVLLIVIIGRPYVISRSARAFDLNLDGIAPQDIIAPEQIIYISEVETKAARGRARDSVNITYTRPDPKVARQQVDRLRKILDYMDTVRSDHYSSQVERIEFIAAVPDLTLSDTVIGQVLILNDDAWAETRQEALAVLNEAMRSEIREEQVSAASSLLPNRIALDTPEEQANVIIAITEDLIEPNTFPDKERTEADRQAIAEAVEPIAVTIEAFELIVAAGQRVGPSQLEALNAAGFQSSRFGWLEDFVIPTILILLITTPITVYYLQHFPTIFRDGKYFIFFISLIVAFVVLVKFNISGFTAWYPLVALAMMVVFLVRLRPQPKNPPKRHYIIRGLLLAFIFILMGSFILLYQPAPTMIAELAMGDVAPSNIVAPNQIVYTSQIDTEADRERARNSIPTIYFPPNPQIGREQFNRLGKIFGYFDTVRADPYDSLAEKFELIAAVPDLTLSDTVIDQILIMNDQAWADTRLESLATLNEAMNSEIRESQVLATRRQLPSKVALDTPDEQTVVIVSVTEDLIKPNTFPDEEHTEAERQAAFEAVEPVVVIIEAGQIIIPAGQVVGPKQLEALEALGLGTEPSFEWLEDFIIPTSFMILLTAIISVYFVQYAPQILAHSNRLVSFVFLLLFFVALARFMIPDQSLMLYLFPMAGLTMVIVLLVDIQLAFILTPTLAFLGIYLATGNAEATMIFLILGGWAGALIFGTYQSHRTLIWVGIAIGVVNIIIISVSNLIDLSTSDGSEIIPLLVIGFINGIVSAIFVFIGLQLSNIKLPQFKAS